MTKLENPNLTILMKWLLQVKAGWKHPHLGEVHAGGVGAQQPALNVPLHPLQDAVFVQEVNFVLRGVHVDIHILGADF